MAGRSRKSCCPIQEILTHSNHLVPHPQKGFLFSDQGKYYPFESHGPTPTVGIHVDRSRKTLHIRITWSYTHSRDSCCPIQDRFTIFESPGPTFAVGIHVIRCRKTLLIRKIWSYTRSRISCYPIQKNLTHSNNLVLHP